MRSAGAGPSPAANASGDRAPHARFGQHRACEDFKPLVGPAVDPLGHAEPGRAAERELGRVR